MRAAFADAARLNQETTIAADGNAGVAAAAPFQKLAVEQFQTGATAAQVHTAAQTSRACTAQTFAASDVALWQCDIAGVAHCIMDCFEVLGTLDDAPDDA